MKLLTYQSDRGPRVSVLTAAGVEDVAPETGDACAVIAAGGAPRTNGRPRPLASVRLLPPVAELRRPVIAVGLNYKKHADESTHRRKETPGTYPKIPVFFCKWMGSHNGPEGKIVHHAITKHLDYEAELVVVIGKRARDVSEGDAWSYIAGVTCGQDISDREEQFRAFQQYTMAKSFDTYAPTGPYLVTLDELDDRDNVPLGCYLNDEQVQSGGTGNLIFSVPNLIAWTSRVCTLEPGDLLFTGTPAGVGAFRDPPRWLEPGIVVRTEIPGVGTMENPVTAG